MANSDTSAVRVDRLEVVRGGRRVLPELSFTVPRGQVTGLLGPSGSGKSTLMRALVGVQKVQGGTVEVLGLPAGARALRDRVGYVTQAPSVYPDLTVTENLAFFARVLQAPVEHVDEVLEQVDLTDHATALAGRLCGGQLSRVSLGVALLGSPELLVLDEPTVGLDPVLRGDLWALFHRLADRGATLLVSSHVMDGATRCDRLLLLREGELVADDTPQGLLDRTGAAEFPFIVMFLVTSVTTLRERSSGTLERLLTTPMNKTDLLAGYALAFGLVALVQAVVAVGLCIGLLGLDVQGEVWALGLVAVLNAVLGTALGLFVSAFAETEFQAVQFMPALVLAQVLLCGLFVQRDTLPDVLSAISDVLPLSYAVDAMREVQAQPAWTADLSIDVGVIAGFALLALAIGAATLRRRTA